jgi:hypothetical protein
LVAGSGPATQLSAAAHPTKQPFEKVLVMLQLGMIINVTRSAW